MKMNIKKIFIYSLLVSIAIPLLLEAVLVVREGVLYVPWFPPLVIEVRPLDMSGAIIDPPPTFFPPVIPANSAQNQEIPITEPSTANKFIVASSTSSSTPQNNPPPQRFQKPGITGIEEDAGKENVKHLPEVEALRKKYGEDRLFINALDRHLIGHEAEWHTNHAAMMEHDALLYSVRPDWDPKITGCVIVVYAGGEGYVYQEDKSLKVIGTETLAQFLEKTKNAPPALMYRFFLSFH